MHDNARQWLDTISSDCEIMDAEQRIHHVYREIGNTLVHQQAKMLKEYTTNFLEILHLFIQPLLLLNNPEFR